MSESFEFVEVDRSRIERRPTRQVKVGSVPIGGGAPVAVQTMTLTDTRDAEATLEQIRRVAEAGCDIVRVAVPDRRAAVSLERICGESPIPVVADIHFNYRLALMAIERGAAKIRINPGNIGGPDRIQAVVDACGERGIPIRVGVNSGSLEKPLLEKYGAATPEALAESAVGKVAELEAHSFRDIVVSIKANDVWRTVEACRAFSRQSDCPLHLGVTEAGLPLPGTVKSAIALGILLGEGIGDTIRVSLTADPVEEVRVGWEIVRSLGIRSRGPTLVACPGCGRCDIDLIDLTERVQLQTERIEKPIRLAVMGCAVNGPGEAQEADVAVCGSKDGGLILRHGQVVRRVPEDRLLDAMLEEIDDFLSTSNDR